MGNFSSGSVKIGDFKVAPTVPMNRHVAGIPCHVALSGLPLFREVAKKVSVPSLASGV